MGVLIKGMKMPKSCGECPCICLNWSDIGCAITGSRTNDVDSRLPDCPLVEIPPHGRLIDADKLENIFWSILNKPDEYDKPLHDMVLELQTAPTVIESEEQEYERSRDI